MKKFYTAVLTLSLIIIFSVSAVAQFEYVEFLNGFYYGEAGYGEFDNLYLGAADASLLDFTVPGGGARALPQGPRAGTSGVVPGPARGTALGADGCSRRGTRGSGAGAACSGRYSATCRP